MKCPSQKTWSAYWGERPSPELALHIQECSACRDKARDYERIIGQIRVADYGKAPKVYWSDLKRTILSSLPGEFPASTSNSFWRQVRSLWRTPFLRPGLAAGMVCLAIAAYIGRPSLNKPFPLRGENPDQIAAWFAETNDPSMIDAVNLDWSDEWTWSQTEAAQYLEDEFLVEEAMEHFDLNELESLIQAVPGRSL